MNVVLLSGGLDSAVCLAMAVETGEPVLALSFDYGQTHGALELECARKLAHRFGVSHRVVELPRVFGPSLLSDSADTAVVPARNTVFLAFASAFALAHGASRIWIGSTLEDRDSFPDCRPVFFESWACLARVLDHQRLLICVPLLPLTKAEVVALAEEHNIGQCETWSCYTPHHNRPCQECSACRTRTRGYDDFSNL